MAMRETAAAVRNEADGERVSAEGPLEVVADKGYPSNALQRKLGESGMRSYIPEPERGRRNCQGRRLTRRRGESMAGSFAHRHETGAMRRAL
jgi:transposase